MREIKILFLSIGFVSIIFSCEKESLENDIIFSGKIENPNSDSLSILNKNQEVVKTIYLKKDNTFRDTLHIAEGYYSLSDGKERTQVFLKPKFDLNFSLNTEEFDESIIYNGKGANENNYLAKKALLEQTFGELNYYGYYAKLSEKDFLKLTDSLYKIQTSLLKEFKNLDEDFLFIESKSLEFKKLERYSSFEGMNRYVTENKDFKVSDSYPNPFENVDLSNEKLLISPTYLFYIQSYLRIKSGENIDKEDENIDYTLEYLKTIQAEVKNKRIKEELVYSIGKWDLNYTKKLDSVYNQMIPYLRNKKYLKEVTDKYEKLKRIAKGTISPVFELTDINGKTVSLTQLKGSLVYIDIWATWCMPCIKEIPSLKKMEEHFSGKDIQFVSICKSDSKDRWEKMVEEKKLGGIQLFAEDENISFFKDYSVQGIPRFILIDKEGKIIDANAKRPSNTMLIGEIEGYL
jgi:thiol-disulfide isomerase/thioredoxin